MLNNMLTNMLLHVIYMLFLTGLAIADTRPGAGNGSRLFEPRPWMWSYGRGQAREVSVAEAEARRKERICTSRQQAAATLKRCLEQHGADFYEPQR
jgi:hypothetical protein